MDDVVHMPFGVRVSRWGVNRRVIVIGSFIRSQWLYGPPSTYWTQEECESLYDGDVGRLNGVLSKFTDIDIHVMFSGDNDYYIAPTGRPYPVGVDVYDASYSYSIDHYKDMYASIEGDRVPGEVFLCSNWGNFEEYDRPYSLIQFFLFYEWLKENTSANVHFNYYGPRWVWSIYKILDYAFPR